MTEHTGPVEDNRKDLEKYLSLAVPLTSFGGIAVAVALQYLNIIPDAGEFFWGCVIGSVCLAYLAWIKPRRDIVSLFAPVYAFLIFIVPLEIRPNLVMQGLFAASITILLVRLIKRFGTPVSVVSEENTMEKYLYDYMHRISPHFRDMDLDTSHDIGSTVLSFKFGLYQKTMQSAENAIVRLPDAGAIKTLKKALEIIRDRAENLENAQVKSASPVTFNADDDPYLAIVIPPEKVEDPDELKRDNAIVLLYAVAYLESPDDGQSLDEHQNYVIQILTSYKEALGL
ncbi:MAG TPA: hypothetical protein VMW63_11115 [Methanoregulaceae archaeon]|nr:hypothetical protein [Methanoregulaceae archaeon]